MSLRIQQPARHHLNIPRGYLTAISAASIPQKVVHLLDNSRLCKRFFKEHTSTTRDHYGRQMMYVDVWLLPSYCQLSYPPSPCTETKDCLGMAIFTTPFLTLKANWWYEFEKQKHTDFQAWRLLFWLYSFKVFSYPIFECSLLKTPDPELPVLVCQRASVQTIEFTVLADHHIFVLAIWQPQVAFHDDICLPFPFTILKILTTLTRYIVQISQAKHTSPALSV